MRLSDDHFLWLAIVGATLAKFLLTEEEIPPDETRAQKWRRRRRYLGSGVAGIVLGYFGNQEVADWLGFEDPVLIACALVLMGERVAITLMNVSAQNIKDAIAAAVTRGGGRSS